MDKAMVLLMATLLCCSFGRSSPLQGLVERDSRPSASQQQRRVGKLHDGHDAQEAGGLTYVQGDEPEGYERGGPRRRRLTTTATTAATKSATNQQPESSRKAERRPEAQEQEAGGKTTTTQEVLPAAAAAAVAAAAGGGSRVNAADGTPGLLEGAPGEITGRAGRVETVDALEGQSQQTLEGGGTVEAVEGMNAEDDKGIKEGEVEGFVVVAGDDKSEEGNPGDSLDNDNGSTSGISNNIMVIVFCALAFVANGGFLVYVFWVM